MTAARHCLTLVCLTLALAAGRARASTIFLGGTITQSVQDTGTSALNNTSLNNIVDGDPFTITMDFAGAILSPGTFTLTSIVFSDSTAGASESAFISGNMVTVQSGSLSQFSVLGCLIDSASCLTGNQLAVEFEMPSTMITQAGVTPQAIPSLLFFDLLEDGGSTDIQGTLTSYSYTGPSGASAPEPSSPVQRSRMPDRLRQLSHRESTGGRLNGFSIQCSLCSGVLGIWSNAAFTKISNGTISGFSGPVSAKPSGIYLAGTGAKVEDVTVSNNGWGILATSNLTVVNAVANNNVVGIACDGVLTITGSQITNNGWVGVTMPPGRW